VTTWTPEREAQLRKLDGLDANQSAEVFAALDAARAKFSDATRALEALRCAVNEVAVTIENEADRNAPSNGEVASRIARWARVLRHAVTARGTP